jgi:hypothetical protein
MATIAVTGAPVEQLIRTDRAVAQPRFKPWTATHRFLWRVGAIFAVQLIIQFRSQFWQRFLPHSLRDFYSLFGTGVTYVNPAGESGRWGVGGFVNWAIALVIAVIAGSIWTWLARNSKRTEYTVADYCVRLAVRYWVALSILHYGYIKVYPVQMPFPSFANSHTLIGEIAPYRYFWAIVGLSTWYQILLGTIEVICGSLMFFRRTLAIGSILTLGVLSNVAYANFAYDGGVHILSTEIALLAGYLLIPYVSDLYRLLVKKEDVVPDHYHPVFDAKWKNHAFAVVKYAAWIIFIPLYLYSNIHNYVYTNQSKEPRAPGLSGAKGYYAVTEFKLNGQDIPYSPLDPVRWHDVTFEDYPTLTYKVDKALPIRLENGGQGIRDAEKTYELAGYAGGRTYLHMQIDESQQTLTVQDKNTPGRGRNADEGPRQPALFDQIGQLFAAKTAAAQKADAAPAGQENGDNSQGPRENGGGQKGRGGRGARGGARPVQTEVWHYTRPSDSRIILTGTTFDNQQFYAVLDRVGENQAIHISSPVPGQPLQYSRQFGRRYPATPPGFDGTFDSPRREFGD